MTFKFHCKFCQSKIEAPIEYKGTSIDCPTCNERLHAPSPTLSTGTIMDDYTIDALIGAGSMGEVYSAQQTTMERDVAIKFIHQDKLEDDEERARFQREIKNLAKLTHPNIIGAIAAGKYMNNFYLVMNLVIGHSCEDLVEDGKAMDPKQALTYGLQVADALKYTWGNFNMLHRDLKPANIMIDKASDRAMLADMGIAKSIGTDIDLTMGGMVIGSPYYMSPEQAAGEDLDQRSDIYGLGATLYHLFSGVPPYDGGAPMQVLSLKLSKNPAPLSKISPDLPEDYCKLVAKLMKRDINERPADWEEAISLIKKVLKGKSIDSKKAVEPKRNDNAKPIRVNANNAAKSPARKKAAPAKSGGCLGLVVFGFITVAGGIKFFL